MQCGLKRIERSFEQGLRTSTNKSLSLFGVCVAFVFIALTPCIETKRIETLQTFKNKKIVHGVSSCNSHTVVRNLNVEAHLNLKFWGVVFFTLNF